MNFHPSSLFYPLSSIQHRVSSIQHRVSSIQHRASSIQNPAAGSTAIHPAAGSGILAFDPGLDDIGGTADTRINADGAARAVQGTRTALHTAVAIMDDGFAGFQLKNAVGTDNLTQSAADTCPGFKMEGCYTRKVS